MSRYAPRIVTLRHDTCQHFACTVGLSNFGVYATNAELHFAATSHAHEETVIERVVIFQNCFMKSEMNYARARHSQPRQICYGFHTPYVTFIEYLICAAAQCHGVYRV